MRSDRQKGFVMFIVVIMLSLVGMILVVISNNLKNIADETTAERLKVYNGLLQSSSLAWIKQNKLELAKKDVGETVQLDVDGFGINGASSAIEIVEIENGDIRVQIKTECSRGRLKVKKNTKANLKAEL
jgi:hypothetical protein